MILFIAPILAWLYDQAADIASGVGDFLRSIPASLAPSPAPLSAPYTPPFTDGQCVGVLYNWRQRLIQTTAEGAISVNEDATNVRHAAGALLGVRIEYYSNDGTYRRARTIMSTSGGDYQMSDISIRSSTTVTVGILDVTRISGSGSCGDPPNPAPAGSIPNGDLFKPSNPPIVDGNNVVDGSAIVLAPALPLVLVTALAAGYAAALAAAKAAADALEAVKKIAEGLEALKSLWDKLKEFLDEWEKNRPKKRDIVRQTYGQVVGDGALDFFSSNNQKAKAIQLDIIITNIPIGIGKYYGSLSPSRYRYKELGYIAFYSVNQGILETHSIQFKRTTLQIPELAVGFIYHLGLDEAIRGYAFGTFSIEKE